MINRIEGKLSYPKTIFKKGGDLCLNVIILTVNVKIVPVILVTVHQIVLVQRPVNNFN